MVVWDLKGIYDSKTEEELIKELKQRSQEFAQIRHKLNELSPKEFLAALKQKEQLSALSYRLSAYASLWLTENTADPKRNAHHAMISELLADLDNELMFFSLWFKSLEDAEAKPYIAVSENYHYMLERMRASRKYTLKEKEEQIINLKDLTGSDAITRLYDIVTNRFKFLYNGKLLSQEEMNRFKQSANRKERKASYDLVLGRYGEEEVVLGEIYKTIANDCRNEDIKLRGFTSPISVRNHDNDIPDAAVDALLSVVRKNAGVFQEYFKIKAKLCKLENIDRYDLYAPYSSIEKKYSFEECKKITLETYKEFSGEAHSFAKNIFDNHHVHSDLIENKQSGAFCYSILPNMDPYILLNHVGMLNDLFTMVHECGHGIHSIAARKQTLFTFHSALPMAETASIFGEMLLTKKMLKEGNKEEKIAVLMRALDNQYASITRQAYFVIFEKQAHEIASGATIDELNEIYMDTLKEQFGNMPIADVFKHEWKYIPHIYHTPFYCYAYTFGNLLVLSLYNRYEKEGESFVPKYMKMLSHGGSESPAKILQEMDIDITQETFWQQGFDIIKEEIEELKKITQ